MYYSIFIVTLVTLIIMGNYQNISASSHNNNNTYKPKNSPFYLPFNLHIDTGDKTYNEKMDSNDILPFP